MLDMRTLQGFEARRPLALPLLGSRAVAGFPSPADDHMERRLDLNEHLVRNPLSTFFLRVDGAWSLRADSPRWPGWSLPFTPECRIWGTVVAVVRRC